MKWIGQHIWDFISRFRSDVYIDDDATLNVKTIKSASTINLTLPDQSYVNLLNGSQYFGHIGSDIDSKFTVFTLYESIASPVDNFNLFVYEHGNTKITTHDAAGTAAHFEIEADGNITLDAEGDIILEAAGNDITMDTDNLHLTSSTQYYPQLILEGTETSIGAGPMITLRKNAADSADGEFLGYLLFQGENSAGTNQSFAGIKGSIEEVDSGDECGEINIQVAHEGSLTDAFVASSPTAASVGEASRVNVTIANAIGSTTTVAGNLTVNSSIRGKSIYVETCNFSDNLGTTEHFIPFVTASENTAFTNVAVPWIAPAAGKLLKVHWRSSQHCNISSNEMSFRLYKISDGTRWSGTNESLLGTKVVTGPSRLTHAIADFTSGLESGAGSETNAFAANDILGVSIQHSQAQGTVEKVTVTLVFELDFSSY